jgi:prevent-host-death family protein
MANVDTTVMSKKRKKAVKTVSATEFGMRSLALLREAHQLRQTVLITKRGKPAARLVPAGRAPFLGRLRGIIKVVGDITRPITPLEDWECLRDDSATREK